MGGEGEGKGAPQRGPVSEHFGPPDEARFNVRGIEVRSAVPLAFHPLAIRRQHPVARTKSWRMILATFRNPWHRRWVRQFPLRASAAVGQ